MSKNEKILNVPNSLTALRLILIPVFFYLFTRENYLLCLIIIIISGLSDFFDGKLARSLGQQTHFGAIFDPIADKLMILAYFGYLFHLNAAPAWFVLLLYLRNTSQLMAIPILSWWLKRPFNVVPKWQPKWASALSFVLIPMFFVAAVFSGDQFLINALNWSTYALMLFSSALEIYVLITYLPRLYQIAVGTHDTFE